MFIKKRDQDIFYWGLFGFLTIILFVYLNGLAQPIFMVREVNDMSHVLYIPGKHFFNLFDFSSSIDNTFGFNGFIQELSVDDYLSIETFFLVANLSFIIFSLFLGTLLLDYKKSGKNLLTGIPILIQFVLLQFNFNAIYLIILTLFASVSSLLTSNFNVKIGLLFFATGFSVVYLQFIPDYFIQDGQVFALLVSFNILFYIVYYFIHFFLLQGLRFKRFKKTLKRSENRFSLELEKHNLIQTNVHEKLSDKILLPLHSCKEWDVLKMKSLISDLRFISRQVIDAENKETLESSVRQLISSYQSFLGWSFQIDFHQLEEIEGVKKQFIKKIIQYLFLLQTDDLIKKEIFIQIVYEKEGGTLLSIEGLLLNEKCEIFLSNLQKLFQDSSRWEIQVELKRDKFNFYANLS